MIDITNFVVNPVTLALVIMAGVQVIKDFGVSGNWLKVASFAVGGVLAFTFKARELWPLYAEYIDIGFFVLASGVSAMGGYSLIKQFVVGKESEVEGAG